MTTWREAAQQALEALEDLADCGAEAWSEQRPCVQIGREAITVLRAALAEPDWQDLYLKEKKRADMWRDKYESVAGAEQRIYLLAEPEGGGNLPPPLQKPEEFDHSIGADRFKVMRGAFWWHVLIGDSPTEHGKFHSRAGAEKMAADLLREFRNGAFVQHEAALAEPVQEPLTKQELHDLLVKIDPNTQRLPAAFVLFAHAIERAHGIGGEE